MSTWVWIVIVLAVVVVVGLIAVLERQRRSAALRDKFGPEYDRAVASHDNQRAAEAELRERQKQREQLDIKPLSEAARLRYDEEWRVVQERFVDQPTEAVASADRLIESVMTEQGYPMADFDEQSKLISVDHPTVVEDYRAARAAYEQTRGGEVGTENLREALLRYRALFSELVGVGQDRSAEPDPDGGEAIATPGALTPDGGGPESAQLATGAPVVAEHDVPAPRTDDSTGTTAPAQTAGTASADLNDRSTDDLEASHDARR